MRGLFAFAASSLLLYNGRAVALAGPFKSGTRGWAVERLLTGGSEDVVDLSWSININNPTLRVRNRSSTPVATTGRLVLIEQWIVREGGIGVV